MIQMLYYQNKGGVIILSRLLKELDRKLMSKLQNSYLIDNYGGHVSEILIEKTKDSTNKFYGLQNLAEDEALNIHEIENKLINQGGN
jgi:hypothetical protein